MASFLDSGGIDILAVKCRYCEAQPHEPCRAIGGRRAACPHGFRYEDARSQPPRIATDAEIEHSRAELRRGNALAKEQMKDVQIDPRIAAALKSKTV